MTKFKIFLVTLSLMSCSSFAFATNQNQEIEQEFELSEFNENTTLFSEGDINSLEYSAKDESLINELDVTKKFKKNNNLIESLKEGMFTEFSSQSPTNKFNCFSSKDKYNIYTNFVKYLETDGIEIIENVIENKNFNEFIIYESKFKATSTNKDYGIIVKVERKNEGFRISNIEIKEIFTNEENDLNNLTKCFEKNLTI